MTVLLNSSVLFVSSFSIKVKSGTGSESVSYTHLDVYKRQGYVRALHRLPFLSVRSAPVLLTNGCLRLVCEAPPLFSLFFKFIFIAVPKTFVGSVFDRNLTAQFFFSSVVLPLFSQ